MILPSLLGGQDVSAKPEDQRPPRVSLLCTFVLHTSNFVFVGVDEVFWEKIKTFFFYIKENQKASESF